MRADVPGMAPGNTMISGVFVIAARAAIAFALGWLVLLGYRSIRRRSDVIGTIVGITILGRIGAGLFLFWVSYLELPIGESLQRGGGFWMVALDATGYFELGAQAVDARAFFPLDHSAPSPVFLNVLALWMFLVGISPAAGLFLNLAVYVGLIALLVRCYEPVNDYRRDLPCIVGMAAYSFSPVILFNSTQPLKDELFIALAGMACCGVLALRPLIQGSAASRRPAWLVVLGFTAVPLAIFGAAGIRWYYALIMWASLAVMLAFFTVARRTTSAGRYLAVSVVLLAVAGAAFVLGAGPYARVVTANFERARIGAIGSDVATMAELARVGFLMSGGGTNVVVPLRDDPTVGQEHHVALVERQRETAYYEDQQAVATARAAVDETAPAPMPPSSADMTARTHAARAIPRTTSDYVKTVLAGLGVLFVPTPILNAAFSIEIPAGRGLLAWADLDTLFIDVSLVLVFTIVWRRRHAIGDRLPIVIFGLTLATATALLLGYVVTNFGTLFRMRPMVTVPLWLVTIAVRPVPSVTGTAVKDRVKLPADV